MRRLVNMIPLIASLVLVSLVLAASGAQLVDHYGTAVYTDADSTTCLLCHDGSGIAPTISHCDKDCGFFDSHPVDQPYPPPGKEDNYAPVSTLSDAGVLLLNGNISCISCHNLALTGPYQLGTGLSGSSLCFVCHVK